MTNPDKLLIVLFLLQTLQNFYLIYKIRKTYDEAEEASFRAFRICENMSDLGRLFQKKKWLSKNDRTAKDPQWNWGDGR